MTTDLLEISERDTLITRLADGNTNVQAYFNHRTLKKESTMTLSSHYNK